MIKDVEQGTFFFQIFAHIPSFPINKEKQA